jgi:hypothetical protein
VTRILANKYFAALLVVVAVAAEFGLASVSHPTALAGPKEPAAARAAVSAAVRACPGPGSAAPTASGVALAAASAGGTGKAEVSRLSPAGAASVPSPLTALAHPGELALVNVPVAHPLAKGTTGASGASSTSVTTVPARGGVMISASGSLARGLEAEQTTPSGMGTAQCQGPGTDFWFIGPGQKPVGEIRLYLMNTDNQTADASVQVLTDSGPVLGGTDSGISVPPHGIVMQSLAGLLKGSRVISLNVTTSVGRVSAAVLETTNAANPGTWLPPALPPAKTQVLPGLPNTPGSRELYVAVPGSNNAQLKVTAVTGKGSFQPTGGTGIDLPGGSAVAVALPSLGGIPAAIQVSSNVPVTASMLAAGGQAGAPGAFTAASAPVQEQGVIAGNPPLSGGATALILSAPHAAARVRVAEIAAAGSPPTAAPKVVQVPAGHSEVVPLSPPRRGGRTFAFGIVVTPLSGSGPVYAGRVVSQNGVARSILLMPSSLTWVPLPAVRNSMTSARS